MEKNLEYYLKLPYTRELTLGSDGIWFIRIKELPGCFSQGNTAEEALRMIDDALAGYIEVELEDNETIPEPRSDEEFSGKFVVRVPKSLHRKISEVSVVENVSLNQWIVTTLAEAIGETRVKKADLNKGNIEVSSGLYKAIVGVLNGIYVGNPELKIDEETFSGWLDGNIADIFTELDRPSGNQFAAKTSYLLKCLTPHKDDSPLISSFCELLLVMVEIGSKYLSVVNKQNQISEIIHSINQTASSKPTQDTLHDKKDFRSLDSNILRDFSSLYDLRS